MKHTYDCFNFNVAITDHNMTGLCINAANVITPKPVPPNTGYVNFQELNSFLLLESWQEVYGAENIQQAYSLFINKLHFYINSATPLPNKKIKNLKPWINSALVKRINLKNKIGLKCRKHPQNLSLKNRYKNLSNLIKQKVAKSKENFYRSKFNACAGDVKKQWGLMNDITNKTA